MKTTPLNLLALLATLALALAACGDDDNTCDPGYATPDCTPNTVADFEDQSLAAESHYIGDATGVTSYQSGDATFGVYWTDEYGFDVWEGVALSNESDTTTPGFDNQFSAIPGAGQGGAGVYAVAYTTGFVLQAETRFPDATDGVSLAGFYVTNTTYAYLSMANGDDYAKKFGGADGTDPDWFLLTIDGLDANGASTGQSVEVYLADFRSDDPTEDFILDDWTWVDLSDLGAVHGLRFSLSSSDVGDYGMNTPAYFAFDSLLFL